MVKRMENADGASLSEYALAVAADLKGALVNVNETFQYATVA